MNLNESNDKKVIKRFVSNNLPRRHRRGNLKKFPQQERLRTLITQMGDRPNVTNVCLILTSAVASDFPLGNLTQLFQDVCDHVILLRHGGNKNLQEVPDTVCPNGETFD